MIEISKSFFSIAKVFGIDLVHFGLVVIFNMMIGLSTPPFGMLLFLTLFCFCRSF